MTIGERLRAERERLGFSQEDFAAFAGAHRKSQGNYESGARAPDAEYLAAIAAAGADVHYILTGLRDAPPPEVISADERELLALFRAAPLAVKAAAIGALQGGAQASPRTKHVTVTARGRDTQAAGRKIINKGGKS